MTSSGLSNFPEHSMHMASRGRQKRMLCRHQGRLVPADWFPPASRAFLLRLVGNTASPHKRHRRRLKAIGEFVSGVDLWALRHNWSALSQVAGFRVGRFVKGEPGPADADLVTRAEEHTTDGPFIHQGAAGSEVFQYISRRDDM